MLRNSAFSSREKFADFLRRDDEAVYQNDRERSFYTAVIACDSKVRRNYTTLVLVHFSRLLCYSFFEKKTDLVMTLKTTQLGLLLNFLISNRQLKHRSIKDIFL